jgi:hypothetical protein
LQEQVTSTSEVTLYAIKPEEIFNFEHTQKVLKNLIPSIAKKLLLIDTETDASSGYRGFEKRIDYLAHITQYAFGAAKGIDTF